MQRPGIYFFIVFIYKKWADDFTGASAGTRNPTTAVGSLATSNTPSTLLLRRLGGGSEGLGMQWRQKEGSKMAGGVDVVDVVIVG